MYALCIRLRSLVTSDLGLVVTGGWSRCAVASRIGSVAIGCPAGMAVRAGCPQIGGWLGAGPRQFPGWRTAKFP